MKKKKNGRNFSVPFHMKDANLKRLHYRIPLTRHPQKGKTMEKVKRSVVASSRSERLGRDE